MFTQDESYARWKRWVLREAGRLVVATGCSLDDARECVSWEDLTVGFRRGDWTKDAVERSAKQSREYAALGTPPTDPSWALADTPF